MLKRWPPAHYKHDYRHDQADHEQYQAMLAEIPAIPVRPRTPAINAMIKNVNARLSICFSLVVHARVPLNAPSHLSPQDLCHIEAWC